jgi:hypothetical protein
LSHSGVIVFDFKKFLISKFYKFSISDDAEVNKLLQYNIEVEQAQNSQRANKQRDPGLRRISPKTSQKQKKQDLDNYYNEANAEQQQANPDTQMVNGLKYNSQFFKTKKREELKHF